MDRHKGGKWVKSHGIRYHVITRAYNLTHCGRDKMAAILHTTFSNVFYSIYECMRVFLRFHWNLFWTIFTLVQMMALRTFQYQNHVGCLANLCLWKLSLLSPLHYIVCHVVIYGDIYSNSSTAVAMIRAPRNDIGAKSSSNGRNNG